jgi:hypothetical protein
MELVDNPYVSPFTKLTLEQFGWKDGDPIPVELGDKLVALKETLPPSPRTDVLIDAAVMPAEELVYVQEMLAEAKVASAQQAEQRKKNAELDNIEPHLRDQYAATLQQFSVIDDRAEAQAAAPVPPPPVKEEPAAPAPPAAVSPAEMPLAPLAPILPFCPRCGWDMRQKFEVEITDRDKEDFLATMLGNSRFRKEYELMGGKLKVVFRSVLAEENKLIYRQLLIDQQESRVSSEAEWVNQLMDYRLVCSLESITTGKGIPLAILPELKDVVFEADKKRPLATPLEAQLAELNKTSLSQEVTRRLINLHLRQFQRLVEAMEAMTLEPSFWEGIE